MKVKEYEMPDGRKAVFEYDENGVGEVTLECMDELMGMIADRPQGEWEIFAQGWHAIRRCSNCKWTQTYSDSKYMGYKYNYCPNCGARMLGEDDEA